MPPANIVRPAIAEAGSISGAWAGDECDGLEGREGGEKDDVEMQMGSSQGNN